MIKMLELREIIKLISKSSIQEFTLKNRGVRISMKKPIPVTLGQSGMVTPQEIIHTSFNEAAVTVEDVHSESKLVRPLKDDAKKPELHKIISIVIGVFSSSEPGTEPYVKVGDRITAGTLLGNCKVQPLNLYHEIASDINGEIIEVLVDDGEIVEYGQPLFLVKAE